jgi:hypothetical protein
MSGWVICRFGMNRVIGRKLYDTDRAEQIAQHAPNRGRGDFHYLVETLCRTPSDEYVLHCEGGAATEYSQPCDGGGRTAGEELIPLDEEAAPDWCEERAIDGQIVVAEFDELIETQLSHQPLTPGTRTTGGALRIVHKERE